MSIKPIVDKQEIAEEVAEELGHKTSLIRKVGEFQFKLLSQHIKEEKDDDFKIMFMGTFQRKFKPEKSPMDDIDF